MRYTEFKVGDNEYKLRLAANEMVNIEKKIGANILDIFMKEGQIPTMEELLMVLHGSLQKFQHNITLADTYDIYDEYVDDGGTFEDLIEVIIDVFEVSGFFKKEDLEEGKKKLEESQKKKSK
ncbi:DUF6096 family protein [Sporanaerobacter acetigenes]|uniref:Phage tail assembly chaperone protein, TAC n=1 Tax=Sporanaerobacter acetigenes DSM 13106 TaxID=1123281 RepID=A0A1M5TYR7_9FIRM|nr:DUF6096 family protein [Sporanaerobacter acetigenes]SHH55927.1 hypothetical protein SAMN02745180_00474 [Sporanaerobacter acetigenes DSM 13106]